MTGYISVRRQLSNDVHDVTDVCWLPSVLFLEIQKNHVTFVLLITRTSVETGSGSDVTSGHQLTKLKGVTFLSDSRGKHYLERSQNDHYLLLLSRLNIHLINGLMLESLRGFYERTCLLLHRTFLLNVTEIVAPPGVGNVIRYS